MFKLFKENFNGKYLNVDFEDGVGYTENERIVDYFKRHNLKFEKVEEKKTETIEEKKTETIEENKLVKTETAKKKSNKKK